MRAQGNLAAPDARIRQALGALDPNTGVSVVDVETGRTLFEHNPSKPLKPASTLKLITSAVALRELGPRHSFETETWFGGRQGSSLRKLYVRGKGDPSFTMESAWIMARKIKRIGITDIDKLALDTGYFTNPNPRTGQRAYEAGSSALSFNFNNVTFEICPTQIGAGARVAIEPWEYPIKTEGGIRTISGNGGKYKVDELETKGRGQIRYRLSGTIGQRQDCANVYRSVESPAAYFGYTFIGLLAALNIRVHHGFGFERVQEGSRLVFLHHSKSLAEILRDLNSYSNNIIAEQLVFSFDTESKKTKSREKGLRRMQRFVQELGHPDSEFSFHDGSGLSHDNRVSARILAKVLFGMQSKKAFAPEFEASLPVPGGRVGTLKFRTFGVPPEALRAKTGTIRAVSALAGYVLSQKGRKFAFAILQNQVGNRDRALSREEKLVSTLYSL